jgi:hypothetical protein
MQTGKEMHISMTMYQQINMYQPVFRRQRKIFSAATLLKIIAMTLVLLLALYVQARWKLHGLQRTSDNLTLNYRQLDARLDKLEASGRTTVDTPPGEDIITLQEQVSERRALLGRIDRLSVDTAAGFGDIFEALARQGVPGLWRHAGSRAGTPLPAAHGAAAAACRPEQRQRQSDPAHARAAGNRLHTQL